MNTKQQMNIFMDGIMTDRKKPFYMSNTAWSMNIQHLHGNATEGCRSYLYKPRDVGVKMPMNYIIEGEGALVNEAGEETPLKAGDFALVNPEGLTQVILTRNTSIGTRAIKPLR